MNEAINGVWFVVGCLPAISSKEAKTNEMNWVKWNSWNLFGWLLLLNGWVMAGGPLTRKNSIPAGSSAIFHFIFLVHSSLLVHFIHSASLNLSLCGIKKIIDGLIEGEKRWELTGMKTYNPLSRRLAEPTKRAVNQLTSLLHSIKQKDKSFYF